MKTNINRGIIALTAALALLGLTRSAKAQFNYFTSDTTINDAVTGIAVVGYANVTDLSSRTNGTSPTIQLVSGGAISDRFDIYNASQVFISGGNVAKTLNAFDSSVVTMSGGLLQRNVNVDSTLNLLGGTVNQSVTIRNQGVLNYRGGVLGANFPSNLITIQVRDQGTLNLFGTNITLALDNPDSFGYSTYTLGGSLLDGTDLTGKSVEIQNGTGASFAINPTVVPEPGFYQMSAFVLMGGIGLWRMRSRRAGARKR